MQEHPQCLGYSQPSGFNQPLMISRAVFNALHPMDRLAAQALEKVGRLHIIEEQPGPGVMA